MRPPKVTASTFDRAVSPAKALFFGKIYEQNLFPFPKFNPAEIETLGMVVDSVEKFMTARLEEYRVFDREGKQPDEYLKALGELGLFGLIIPEEYGGIGLSNAGYSRVIQQSSRYDASTSITIGAHSSIGMKGLLLWGTPEQKSRYLPRLAIGEMVAAFCLTEPGAGSDAASIKTTAAKNKDGSWTLNGEKLWISNGAFAEFFTVFARTEGKEGKLTAFIVERAFGGVTSGPKEDKLGIRASATTSVLFNNVKVPAENLLGEEGKGFKVAMSILNNGRTGLGGGCVGGMKQCIKLAVHQATERKQFGQSISTFGLVKDKIAQMAVACFAAEATVHTVACAIDRGSEDYSIEAAISKVYATEAAWVSINEALQIAGGNGFMKDFPYERMMRDCRINMIFEGTNEILRLYIALSGLKDVGESLKEIGKSAGNIFNDPIKGFGVLGGYAAKRLSRLTPFGKARIASVHPELGEMAAMLETYTARFGAASEAQLRRYRKNIIGSQHVTRRLANIAIDLFVGFCTLSRASALVEERGAEKAAYEVALASIFSHDAKIRMTENLQGLEKNEDDLVLKLADHIIAEKKFPWDVL